VPSSETTPETNLEPTPDDAIIVPPLPRRDRIAIITAIVLVTALSWAYLIDMKIRMDQMMGSMDMGNAGAMKMDMGKNMPSEAGASKAGVSGEMASGGMTSGGGMAEAMKIKPWTLIDFGYMLLMWVIMMIGMMVPTAMPMALIYAAIARKALSQGTTLAPTGLFVFGYIVMWSLFSLVATIAQWGLDQAALLSPMMVSTSPIFGALLLVVAGIYQLTPAKNACLEHCRSPAHYISKHWRNGNGGALIMGLEHGAFCLGCCWVLMALLFLGGVMNLLWIAIITLFVLLEKVLPLGDWGGKIAGGGMILFGLVMGGMAYWA
jgi:predicted metal-binding membrane protein